MNALSRAFGNLPAAALVAIGVLVAIQLALQLFSLIDLARRPRVPGGRKWVWVLVIIIGNLLGVIIYLALGRSARDPVSDQGTGGTADARKKALDQLYGGRDRQ